MSKSLVLYVSRSNALRWVDPDTLPHSDDLQPILLIAAAIIVAGYKGVAIDEIRLSNGRYLHAIDVNKSTPEGAILERLQRIANLGGVLPDSETVVASIRQEYGRISGNKGAPLHRGTK